MAMPSSGAISLSNVEREHFHDDPNHSSMPTIQVSLTDFSKSAIGESGGSYAEWDRHANMTAGAPYALSEFYSGVHDFGGE
jgi:hypothetical protein|tara:strand:- start:912 stop:1154 length:243 start_codon:yes stop_codon:yes gene_type:complete